MTLTRAIFPSMSWLTQVMLVLGGTAMIALAAQISVLVFLVPMTFQGLAILIVGFTLGSRLGALTVIAYLAEGAMGLPVFAGGHGGVVYMMGATGGFLLGFVAMAWIAGRAAEAGIAKYFLGTFLAALVAAAVVYIPGILWPMSLATLTGVEAGWVGQDFGSYYWVHFVQPFLIGDAVKAAIAALLLTGGWTALARR